MTIDQLPIRWNFICELAIIFGILMLIAQVKLADILDSKRFNSASMSFLFQVRRAARWLKGMALCWLAVYAFNRGWNIWPPTLAFIVAFDVWVLSDVLVMRKDLDRLAKRDALSGRQPTSSAI